MSGHVDRETAERELTKLIERALRSVPHIRLDKVKAVRTHFEKAIDCLEANLMSSDDDDEPKPKKKAESSTTKAATMQKLKDYLHDGLDSESEEAPAAKVAVTLDSNLMQGGVTKDYSSPSLAARRLGGGDRRPSKSSRANSGSIGLVGGLQGGQKERSRAQIFEEDSDESSDDARSRVAAANNKSLLVGGGVGGSNKLTKDYSSPSLGARRLGAAGESKPKKTSSRASAIEMDVDFSRKRGERRAPSPEPEQEEEARAPKKSAKKADKESKKKREGGKEQEISSPKQYTASLMLLGLASEKGSDSPKTPKAGFLRRLDAPDSNHAKLDTAREELIEMLMDAKGRVGQLRMKAFPEVRQLLLAAVQELEASTTQRKKAS